MRRPIAALVGLVVSLALAAPAAATQPEPVYTFIATIDCGAGPVEVGSTDDLYAPLVDLSSGREYEPVAWSVQVGDFLFEDVLPGASLKRTVQCSYDDGVAKGTVTVKQPRHRHGDDRHGNRGHHGHHRHHGDDGDWDHGDRD